MGTKPILIPDGGAEQTDAQPQPNPQEGWRAEHEPLLALFERLSAVDQQEMLAIAHQKLHIRKLRAAATGARGDRVVNDV